MVPTSSAVYVIGLAKSFASYTLHVTALSPSDGTVLSTADVPSSITEGPESILPLRRLVNGTEAARVVWLEGGKIRSVGLTPDLHEKPTLVKGAAYVEVVSTGLEDHGLFVAIKDDGSGRVVKLDDDNTGLKVIWEFADSVSDFLTLLLAHTELFVVGAVSSKYRLNVFWRCRQRRLPIYRESFLVAYLQGSLY